MLTMGQEADIKPSDVLDSGETSTSDLSKIKATYYVT